MEEKDSVLEALHDGHKSLRQISNALCDTALAFRELTDAITVLLVIIDEAALYRRLSDRFLGSVDRVRDALGKVM